MILGKVTGTVVSTAQHPLYEGKKQLLVRYLRTDGGFDLASIPPRSIFDSL